MIKKVLSYAEKMSIKLGSKRADKDEPKKRPPDLITDNPPPRLERRGKPPIHNPGYPVDPPEMGIKPEPKSEPPKPESKAKKK